MNAKHRKTLAALLAKPSPKGLPYRDVASLLTTLGCVFADGEGSRVSFKRGGFKLQLHRPHPGKELKDYQITKTLRFLSKIGVAP